MGLGLGLRRLPAEEVRAAAAAGRPRSGGGAGCPGRAGTDSRGLRLCPAASAERGVGGAPRGGRTDDLGV